MSIILAESGAEGGGRGEAGNQRQNENEFSGTVRVLPAGCGHQCECHPHLKGLPFRWSPATAMQSGLDAGGLRIFPEDVIFCTQSATTVPCASEKREEELARAPIQRNVPPPPVFLLLISPLVNGLRSLIKMQLTLDRHLADSDCEHFLATFGRWADDQSKSPSCPAPPPAPLRPLLSRPVLVLLNPFGGQRLARQLWQRDVEPLWREAGIPFRLVVTERAGHARELVARVELDQWAMLALGGGDGFVSEAVHGLLDRPDRARALRLPLLHLPMGTGNALATSVAFQANEPLSSSSGSFCQSMALMALRPRYSRLQLYRVEFANRERRTMFLSLSWGLLADIDLASERFRFLGVARFHLEAFLRIIRLPSVARYRATISYLPLPEGPQSEELARKLRKRIGEPRDSFGQGHFGGGESVAIGEEEEDGDNGKMPSLDQPPPEQWRTLTGEFCFVQLTALSHLGQQLPFLPCARPHDSVLFLSFVRWERLSSRIHMARILISIESSAHLDDPVLEIVPVLACRVQPEPGAGGLLALDGEPVAAEGAFQACPCLWTATVVGRTERKRSR